MVNIIAEMGWCSHSCLWLVLGKTNQIWFSWHLVGKLGKLPGARVNFNKRFTPLGQAKHCQVEIALLGKSAAQKQGPEFFKGARL